MVGNSLINFTSYLRYFNKKSFPVNIKESTYIKANNKE